MDGDVNVYLSRVSPTLDWCGGDPVTWRALAAVDARPGGYVLSPSGDVGEEVDSCGVENLRRAGRRAL
jgi:hypothetical protein